MSVLIDFNIDDTWQDLQRLADLLSRTVNGPPSRDVVLDLSQSGYLGPWAATLLAAVHLHLESGGHRVTTSLPASPVELDAFCTFSGLRHLLQRGERPRPDHPNSETVPLQRFFTTNVRASSPLLRLIRRHINLDLEHEEYLAGSLSEVVQNIEDHAASRTGGLWCGRYFRNRREVRVAVVDMGLGIPTTLKETDHPTALRKVFQGGCSSLSRPNNMGLGISNLASWVRELKGSLVLLSRAAVALRQPDRDDRFLPLAYSFPGTGVFFTLFVDESAAPPSHD